MLIYHSSFHVCMQYYLITQWQTIERVPCHENLSNKPFGTLNSVGSIYLRKKIHITDICRISHHASDKKIEERHSIGTRYKWFS